MSRVAIVHDWLTVFAGAERVLEQLLLLYPNADLFAVCDFVPDSERTFLRGRKITTTFIQNLPGARTRYRSYLSLMPLAVEQLDLSGYDLVISSSHAVAKGVLTGPSQLHVSYIHSPIRYAWDMQHEYLRESGLDKGCKGWVAKWMLHKMRLWDLRTANGVDVFIANSAFIARRIWKVYRRQAEVIYPPVDVNSFPVREDKEDYYLVASRLVPYKRVALVAEAFMRMPEKRLKVIGDGPERSKIERIAEGHPNIEVMGYQPREILIDTMVGAKAFVFAAEEDFGIMPVEAQACGTPVIAYSRGGTLETVHGLESEYPTGVFFDEQSAVKIKEAVELFESSSDMISADACRTNAERFQAACFREEMKSLINRCWDEFSAGHSLPPLEKKKNYRVLDD